MPDNKKNTVQPSTQEAMETKKRMEALARAIRDEMGSLTQEELERLYAAVPSPGCAIPGQTDDRSYMLFAGSISWYIVL